MIDQSVGQVVAASKRLETCNSTVMRIDQSMQPANMISQRSLWMKSNSIPTIQKLNKPVSTAVCSIESRMSTKTSWISRSHPSPRRRLSRWKRKLASHRARCKSLANDKPKKTRSVASSAIKSIRSYMTAWYITEARMSPTSVKCTQTSEKRLEVSNST